jgi:hypothetical protein
MAGHDDDVMTMTVDEAFQDLYGFPWGTTFQLPSAAADDDQPVEPKDADGTSTTTISTRRTTTTTLDETTRILVQMLGRTSAARILRLNNQTVRIVVARHQPTRLQETTTMMLPPKSDGKMPSKAIVHKKEQHAKHKVPAAAQSALVAGPAVAATAAATTKPGAVGMDQLLQQLQSKNKVSTIAKTSNDWESFKEQSGLGEKLEQQADSNTAYLQKQDFLARVDHRTFQVERQEREQNRTKRGGGGK